MFFLENWQKSAKIQEMLSRDIIHLLNHKLSRNPAVALLGPRQSGKTTLAMTLSDNYFDLEVETERQRLLNQWGELEKSSQLIVLDEVQSFPELFPKLRHTIDKDRDRNNRFLLLGSVSPAVMVHVSESLAGRVGLVYLTPLTFNEAPSSPVSDFWLYGGFPKGGILDAQDFPEWQKDYVQNLIYRDFPSWGLPLKPLATERLVYMLAALNGTQLHVSQLSKSLGIHRHVITDYLDFLEGAFLIRRLYPYFTNLKKRLIKSPKLYVRDSGLLHALLDTASIDSLYKKPWVGNSWEGFVIETILAVALQKGISLKPYYFRTHDGYEIDLLLELSGELWAIEIKLSTELDYGAYNKLLKVSSLLSEVKKTFLISQSSQEDLKESGGLCNLSKFITLLLEQ